MPGSTCALLDQPHIAIDLPLLFLIASSLHRFLIAPSSLSSWFMTELVYAMQTVGTESYGTGKIQNLDLDDEEVDMQDASDSDASSCLGEADGIFDSNELGDSDTETIDTDFEDTETLGKPNIDIDDQLGLFDGNLHPPEYYRQGIKEFNESALDEEDYSPGSQVLLDDIENQWRCYCTAILARSPHECLKTVSVPVLQKFFEWKLNQKVGKGGRKKKGITKTSSLHTCWKVFRLVYEKAMEAKLDPKFTRKMHKVRSSMLVLRSLAKQYGLNDQKRANRCMTIDDLKDQIETTLSTTRKSFQLGELRILAVLFLLLVAPAGARPTAILMLRFSDIRVVLAKDPEGGPHKLLIRFTPKFTKTYLGAKDVKEFTVPETICDPSLLLSPHVFLLGILFRHRAFQATRLASCRDIERLDIHPGELELPLPLRSDLNDTFVFRRAIKMVTGYEMSATERITYGMIAGWIKAIGVIMGMEYSTIAYSLRYNAANGLDQSPDISEALRNLALDHANSTPFQKHYLGRQVCADTWGVLRGQKPQQALLKQSCSLGHSKSKRRPMNLTAAQVASIDTDPRIRALQKKMQSMPPGSRHKIVREIRNCKQRLKNALLQQIRSQWTDAQAVNDIDRQLQGKSFADSASEDTFFRPQGPAQERLVLALTAEDDGTLQGYYGRRHEAVTAISEYCSVQEGSAYRLCTPRKHKKSASESESESPAKSPAQQVLESVFIQNKKERTRICFLCVGMALSLPPDDPHMADLVREFYSSGDLSKDFRRRHLNLIQATATIECRACEITLTNKAHVKNHALSVHGIVSKVVDDEARYK
ncbi:C2H2 finger domain-containing protein [Paramyrothecium foliicola]|nr:C2H2 finger domain-containing protein [Paramyrothecium foliicola]